jgi:hypothetical protein
VPRVISFIVLLAIVLLVGAVFFQVMAQFLVPLFLACVLVVVFEPLHRWILMHSAAAAGRATDHRDDLVVRVAAAHLVGWRAYSDFHD